MKSAVLRKLQQTMRLDAADVSRVSASFSDSAWFEPRTRLSELRRAETVVFVHEGLVQVYRSLREGGRQTTALLLPGDFATFDFSDTDLLRLELEVISRSSLSILPLETVAEWRCASPALDRAIDHVQKIEQSVAREWLVSLGARSTLTRTAHLFCELRCRYGAIVSGDPDVLDLPLNQIQLGQMLGASVVHMNRVLSYLREEKLASNRQGKIVIHDRSRLEALAAFDDYYLRLGQLAGSDSGDAV